MRQALVDSVRRASLAQWLISGICVGLMFGLGFGVGQADFYPLITLYGLFFGCYLYIVRSATPAQLGFYLLLAVLLRSILLFAPPLLSDDVYRFIWDGRLLIQGYNPFDHLPTYYLEEVNVPGLTPELFQQLNSPEYYTVYPPVAQGVFAFACWLFPTSLAGSTWVMKAVLWLCEIGSLVLLVKLLQRFSLPLKNVLWYALNPLVILEIVGNLHFEGAMICFLLLAMWWWSNQRFWLAAVATALSIGSKLLPLLFLPLLMRRMGAQDRKAAGLNIAWWSVLSYFAVVGMVLLLLFWPLLNGVFINNFGASLDLYFRKFEFNASIYYLVRYLGYAWKGYNMIAVIGPVLASCTFAGIVGLALVEKQPNWKNLPIRMLFAISLYLFLTTTVHPWYTSLPLMCCVFTRFRFPVLWTGLIYLTYINYSYPVYQENYWVIVLEYGLVFVYLLYEWKKIGE